MIAVVTLALATYAVAAPLASTSTTVTATVAELGARAASTVPEIATSSTSTSARGSFGQELLHGRRAWSSGTMRLFLATTIDVGYLYLRPRVIAGWGRPHSTWLGIEANPIFTGTGIGAYGGVRGAVPFVDLRLGVRGYYAFERSYLAPAESYDRLALSSTAGGHASYLTYEAEASVSLPFGPGDIIGLASLSHVEGVPEGAYVYEETLHMIVAPSWVSRFRIGYGWRPIEGKSHSIGPVIDLVNSPTRDTILIRAGLVARIVLSPELEVRGTFVPTIWSEDTIGLLGGDFTELGLRFRWATGL